MSEHHPRVDRASLFARVRPAEVGRTGKLLWLLVLAVVSACVWANWAKLDELVSAPGQIVVSSHSQVVQAVDGGVLSKLLVAEGGVVKRGQVVAVLDPTRFAARVGETAAGERSLRANILRLEAQLAGKPLKFESEFDAWPKLVSAQQHLYDVERKQQSEKVANLKHQQTLASKALTIVASLAKTGDAAEAEVLKARQKSVALESELDNARNEYRSKAREELAEDHNKLEQATQVLKRQRDALQATDVRAPMAGTVSEIKVTTVGAVLGAGDEIMKIVPSDDPLLVEARVGSSDVAFLRPGLKANVKLTAYDFAIYGALHGEVTYVSPDTIDENLARGEAPYYRVLIRITDVPARPGRDAIDIIPGMVAKVEIITGNRTVAEYLMMPLLRGSAVALTER